MKQTFYPDTHTQIFGCQKTRKVHKCTLYNVYTCTILCIHVYSGQEKVSPLSMCLHTRELVLVKWFSSTNHCITSLPDRSNISYHTNTVTGEVSVEVLGDSFSIVQLASVKVGRDKRWEIVTRDLNRDRCAVFVHEHVTMTNSELRKVN